MKKRKDILLFFFILFVLLLNAWWFYPFFSDDSFISLRYSKRFLEGHGLTWNDGEWVEGYTNFLWVLAVAFLGLFKVELVLAARLLGVGSMIVIILAILRTGSTPLSKTVSGIAFAVTGTVGAWAIGGLETPLFGAFLAWAAVFCYPVIQGEKNSTWDFLKPSLLLGFLCLVRLDGMIFVFSLALAIILQRGFKKIGFFVVFPLLFVIGQTAFRLYYYDSWLPNTAYVKLPASLDKIHSGLGYALRGFLAYPLLFGLTAFFLWKLWKIPSKRGLAILFALPIFFWVLYLIYIGGDIFLGYRHILPVLIFSSLCLVQGLELYPPTKTLKWLCVLGLFLHTAIQFLARDNLAARKERWGWNGAALGILFKEAFGNKNPLFATDPAGSIPYYSELPTLDMLGLNDKHIARTPHIEYGWIGHDHGDGAYVLARRPDLVLMQSPWGSDEPSFKSSRELMKSAEFHDQYRLIHFFVETPEPFVSRVWVRWKNGPLAIQWSPNKIVIPGYLFATTRENTVGLDSHHKLAVNLSSNYPLFIGPLQLSKGTWKVKIDAPSGEFLWDLWPQSETDHSFSPQTVVEVKTAQFYRLEIRSKEPTSLYKVTLFSL